MSDSISYVLSAQRKGTPMLALSWEISSGVMSIVASLRNFAPPLTNICGRPCCFQWKVLTVDYDYKRSRQSRTALSCWFVLESKPYGETNNVIWKVTEEFVFRAGTRTVEGLFLRHIVNRLLRPNKTIRTTKSVREPKPTLPYSLGLRSWSS